jgi:KEOPS complex subunit Cgi121
MENIQISGFSSEIDNISKLMDEINRITSRDFPNCVIQLLNADGIAGREHILHATLHAIQAFKRGDNIANDLGLEICVRASAQRQISKALNILGLKIGLNHICAVMVNCNTQMANHNNLTTELEILFGKRNDEVLKADITLLNEIYGISEKEIDTSGGISRAMIERTSLLILET